MKIAVHAGHNPDGKIACGAVGFIKESTAARQITEHLKAMLSSVCSCVDVTVNDGKNQNDILNRLNSRVNSGQFDLSLSIHLNAAASEQANGVEVWYWRGNADMLRLAWKISETMAELGYMNRGSKPTQSLSVIRNTNCPALLLECGFVTSKKDCEIFDPYEIAKKIVKALSAEYKFTASYDPPAEEVHRVQVGAYRNKENAKKMADELKQKGYDAIIVR